ncbi:MAG: hypothetical protein TREMPRED_004003, partial [Tremellales sp. Tagirdzhanova-0007]
MADLAQHSNYTARYSGLLDNLYVTVVIAGVCLLGYEIEIHVPRRRGQEGPFKRIPEGLISEKKEEDGEEDGKLRAARRRLGSREAWEFAYIFQPKAWRLNPSPPVPYVLMLVMATLIIDIHQT